MASAPPWFVQGCRRWVEQQEWKTAWADRLAEALWPVVAAEWQTLDEGYRLVVASQCDRYAEQLGQALACTEDDPEATAYLRGRMDAFRQIARMVTQG